MDGSNRVWRVGETMASRQGVRDEFHEAILCTTYEPLRLRDKKTTLVRVKNTKSNDTVSESIIVHDSA